MPPKPVLLRLRYVSVLMPPMHSRRLPPRLMPARLTIVTRSGLVAESRWQVTPSQELADTSVQGPPLGAPLTVGTHQLVSFFLLVAVSVFQ